MFMSDAIALCSDYLIQFGRAKPVAVQEEAS